MYIKQEINKLVTVSYNFLQYFSKHEIQCKASFHLILFGIPSSLILSVKEKGVGGYLTNKICSA